MNARINVKGKKILFFGIGFYDYESSIKKELEQQGAIVTFFLDRSLWRRSGLLNKISKLPFISIDRISKNYHARILKNIAADSFDYVFVIKGDGLTDIFLSSLRKKLSNARFIMYQWDSLNRVPSAVRQLKYFDKIFSFDRIDCLNNPTLYFRPLFFRDCGNLTASHEKYDMVFIGWLHADRLPIIEKITEWAALKRLNTFFYLYTGIVTYLKNYKNNKSNFLFLRKMPYKKALQINSSAKVILDFPHQLQCGLTMRTIEAVGMGKKLITTNKDVVNYDFYGTENILVIDENLIGLHAGFFNKPYSQLPQSVVEYYKLSRWVSDVFSA